MPDIHELLEKCQTQSEALVREIETFKESRQVHIQVTENLESLMAVLSSTLEEVKPLTEKRIKRLSFILLGGTGLNTLLFIGMVIMMLFR